MTRGWSWRLGSWFLAFLGSVRYEYNSSHLFSSQITLLGHKLLSMSSDRNSIREHAMRLADVHRLTLYCLLFDSKNYHHR